MLAGCTVLEYPVPQVPDDNGRVNSELPCFFYIE